MHETKTIVVATRNHGKLKEMEEFLKHLPFELKTLNDFPSIYEVEETGETFEENATLKAVKYAKQVSLLTLADDSGLEIEELDGAPGVRSARYAGKNATYEQKISELLKELGNKTNRNARFVCFLVLADQNGDVLFSAEGICTGTIASNPIGTNGFGYDPIFVPDGFESTFGELSSDLKQKISHRARAIEKIISFLKYYQAVSLDQCNFRL